MTDQQAQATPEGIAHVGLDSALGFEYVELSGDRVVIRWTVAAHHLQPFSIVHGGVYCAAIESAASMAAFAWLNGRGHAVGVSNQTDFLRSVGVGSTMTATALPIHRGRSQQLWQVEIVDQDGKLTARGQVRLQNLTASE